MAAIDKAIELLEKVLEENYKLSEGYEIKPETRDEIEGWLKWYNDLQKRADGVSPNENSGLNIPVVSNWHFLPELPEINKEVSIAYKYDKKPIQGFWNGKKWIGSFETRDYMKDCYANNSDLTMPEYIYAWQELPDCPEVPTPF